MIERSIPILDFITHAVLIIGVLIIAFSNLRHVHCVNTNHTGSGASLCHYCCQADQFFNNYRQVLVGEGNNVPPCCPFNVGSTVMALVIAIGKIDLHAVGFCRRLFSFPIQKLFLDDFCHPHVPVEVRIAPTYQVVADLGMLGYAGPTLPHRLPRLATFLFRQFFLTVPDELIEAARA